MGRRGTTAGHLLSTDLPIWRWGPLIFKGPLTVPGLVISRRINDPWIGFSVWPSILI